MEELPATDHRQPAAVVAAMVEHVLALAKTWPRWDGVPLRVPMDGEAPRIYTPHKAIRRVVDHLIDHLAEIEARLAGRQTEPDTWMGSMTTTPSDLALFGIDDLNEARNRLRRLALMYETSLSRLSDNVLDTSPGGSWSIRQVAFHVADSAFYADSVGRIS